MNSLKDLEMLERFHCAGQASGSHSSAAMPVTKVQELTSMIKTPFLWQTCSKIFTLGLTDFDLEAWSFLSLGNKEERKCSVKRFEEVECLYCNAES